LEKCLNLVHRHYCKALLLEVDKTFASNRPASAQISGTGCVHVIVLDGGLKI
jgi:hypothetical protein